MAKTIDVSFGCPLPPYIKEERGGRPALGGAPSGGVPLGLLVLVGSPFLLAEGEKGKRGRGKGGSRRLP